MAEWSDLQFLLEIARGGTLAAAARKLEVAETTAGRRLAALERALGAKLATRTPDGLVLTEVGEAVRAAAEEMERALVRAEQRALGADSELSGVVRVATTEMLGELVVVPAVAALRERHPQIRVDLLAGTARLDIARREANVALRYGQPVGADLVVRKAGTVAYGAYASRGYLAARGRPAVGSGFAGHDVLTFDAGIRDWRRGQLGGEPLRDARVVMRSNSGMALLAAIRSGIGIGPLPAVLAARDPRLVRVPAGAPLEMEPAWLVVHPDVHRTSRVRAVIEAVDTRLAAIAGELMARRPERT
ncbi:MAG TPA: LysR substrate-binding domain-containing protein [Myxococcales bacterium]|nr:LysR substrate-binding domain-containing protein [Myxococcales bacterium]